MLASLFTTLLSFGGLMLFSSPFALLITAFQIWMFVDAIRQREYVWAALIFVGWGLAALWYYLWVYRGSPSSTRGFELPGAFDRRRMKHLESQIHYLDKAHHHSQLGDIYFQKGKLDKAEACYRASMERDPQDIDTRAHLGQCLLRLKRPQEARPLLEGVVAENPKHEYGYSLMALAEALTALGEKDAAMNIWQRVTENHMYPRAKVQLAELYVERNQPDLARAELKEVLADDAHAPAFQRKRDRVWIRRAKGVLRKICRNNLD
jgi:tetratricopeptide (TPR) repeat protein